MDVFNYENYRAFLRDYYADRKAHSYGFSFRAFSRRAGLKSPNYLKLVMDGERNLSADMARAFATGCGLDETETDYFCELVTYDQATTTLERTRCHERLGRFKQYRAIHPLSVAQTEYHARWYLPVIRELASRDDFSPDPKWLTARIRPKITERDAKAGIALLKRLGLLVQTEDGDIHQADALVSTGAGPLGHQVANFHRTMMDRAKAAIDDVPREEREISSVTLCVSPEMLGDLKERIREFRRELLQQAELGGKPERVVQLNFQLFPLTVEPPLGSPASETASSTEIDFPSGALHPAPIHQESEN